MNFDYVFDNEPDVMDAGKKIRVVYCEPGKAARTEEIGTELKDLQRAVGGLIETFYPFDEAVCIVCDDESKYDGALPNRAVRDEDGEMIDIIFGPFFICDCRGEEFASLSDEQSERYLEKFKNPEMFFRVGNDIEAVPYEPEKDERLSR